MVKPGRLVGLLHYLVAAPVGGLEYFACYGITYGTGLRIRALTVYKRPEPELFA